MVNLWKRKFTQKAQGEAYRREGVASRGVIKGEQGKGAFWDFLHQRRSGAFQHPRNAV